MLSSNRRRLCALTISSLLITTAVATSPNSPRKARERDPTATLDSDLVIVTTTPAPKNCHRKTHNGDEIRVDYTGRLQSDGSTFDTSHNPGRGPFKFTLGSGMVIPGWDKGLQGMCVNESRRLTIPPHLAYGDGGTGPIPGGATLVFDTDLIEIVGAEDEVEEDADEDTGSKNGNGKGNGKGSDSSKGNDEGKGKGKGKENGDDQEASKGSEAGPKDTDEDESGECKLLGPFALIVQAALGALSLLSLVWKRYREQPRRPVKVWAFDVSKQVFGTVLLHMANLFMSMLSSGSFDVANAANNSKHTDYARFEQNADAATAGKQPNPCSFYLLNLAIDTTIGIPILVGLLKIVHGLAKHTPLAKPPESLQSGNYGHPPRWGWWFKQAILYFIGLFGMKLCVLAIFTLLPWIVWIGDWALRWTEGSNALQIVFVMFVFPLIMNALQYYIIDSFIKDRSNGAGEYQPADGSVFDDGDSDDSFGETNERARLRPSEDSFAADATGENSPLVGGEQHGTRHKEPLAEPNLTPVPMRTYDAEVHGEASRPSADGKENR